MNDVIQIIIIIIAGFLSHVNCCSFPASHFKTAPLSGPKRFGHRPSSVIIGRLVVEVDTNKNGQAAIFYVLRGMIRQDDVLNCTGEIKTY